MRKRLHALLDWMISLFDPPPLATMNTGQKVGRIFLLSATLVIGSILVAMLGAVGLYLIERGREMGSTPQFLDGIGIIIIGIIVNYVCVLMLMQIKHADRKLIPDPKEGEAIAKSQMEGK